MTWLRHNGNRVDGETDIICRSSRQEKELEINAAWIASEIRAIQTGWQFAVFENSRSAIEHGKGIVKKITTTYRACGCACIGGKALEATWLINLNSWIIIRKIEIAGARGL